MVSATYAADVGSFRVSCVSVFLHVAGSATDSKSDIVTLTNPKSRKPIKYMLKAGSVFELQRATPKVPTSWIIDQNICSDGSLLVATRVDPLFLVLPYLEKGAGRFQQLPQLLVDESAPHARELKNCKNLDLKHICDLNGSSFTTVLFCNYEIPVLQTL